MKGKRVNENSGGIATELYFWGQALVFACVILVMVNVFLFRVSGVEGTSMVPTFQDQDQIIMQIIGYNEPQRGDIVVTRAPGYPDKPLVKRVIAVGGDTVDIDRATGNVILNGVAQYEPYISERIREFGNQQFPFTVPDGRVFVLGDNRNGSVDSRDANSVGAIPCEDIIGKVFFRHWPINKIGMVT